MNGGPGTDTANFTGAFAEYDIPQFGNGSIVVTDTVVDRDGTDRLVQVELLAFSDVTVDASTGAVVGAAEGNVVVLHSDGTFNSFATIALAVEAAVSGETIFIGEGTFWCRWRKHSH